jgi:hypothetical protein
MQPGVTNYSPFGARSIRTFLITLWNALILEEAAIRARENNL